MGGGAEIHIFQNVFRGCLTALAFGGSEDTRDKVFVYRNVFDLRPQVLTGRPSVRERDLGGAIREAQQKIRDQTESVDNYDKAKALLEPKGMTVKKADVEAFRKVAEAKIWPAYKKQYPAMWDEIVAVKA